MIPEFQILAEVTVYNFKDFVPTVSWITHSEGIQSPCCEDTPVALWRGPVNEELWPLVNSPHQLASHVNESSWNQIL